MDLPEPGERALKPRLWPAIAIVAAGGLWIASMWIRGVGIRQDRVVGTMGTLILVLIGLALWFLFLSRLPGRVRWSGLGIAILSVAAFFGLFRIKGVTGDMVPILQPRWTRTRPAPPMPIPEPTPAAEAATAAPSPVVAAAPSASVPAAPGIAATPAAAPIASASVTDFPQFQGPRRDATFPELRLFRDWSSRPPRLLWRRPVGDAWSGFVVAGGLAITQEQHGDEERVVAYEARTGAPRWSHEDPARYETVVAGIGPRAVPAVHDGRVFAQGATGILTALDLQTGRRLWSRNVVQENGATLADWGKSASPLVIGNRVVVSAGGRNNGRALVAYDADSGEPVWAAGSDPANYSSPTLLNLGGRPQIVILNRASVAGHDPETGALLWEAPFPSGQPNIALPLAVGGDRVLVSAGYGVGSKLFRLSAEAGGRATAHLEWESPRLKSKFANLIAHDGSIYGLDDGVLTCLDPATGERRWKEGRYGHGQLLLVGGLLLVQTEEGELALVEPSPEGLRERALFRILDGKTWNPPALAGDVLYVRNDREAAAYRLPTEPGSP